MPSSTKSRCDKIDHVYLAIVQGRKEAPLVHALISLPDYLLTLAEAERLADKLDNHCVWHKVNREYLFHTEYLWLGMRAMFYPVVEIKYSHRTNSN